MVLQSSREFVAAVTTRSAPSIPGGSDFHGRVVVVTTAPGRLLPEVNQHAFNSPLISGMCTTSPQQWAAGAPRRVQAMCQLTRMQEVVDLSKPRAASRKAIDLGSEKSLSRGVCCSSDSCYQSMRWHRRPPTIFQKCGRTRLAHALALSQRERVVGFRASTSRLWRVFELRVAFRAQILNTPRAHDLVV